MGRRIPLRSGGEYDALTRWRRVLHWRAGERRYWKRQYRRRERRQGKVDKRGET